MKKDIVNVLRESKVGMVIWSLAILAISFKIFGHDWIQNYSNWQLIMYSISSVCIFAGPHEAIHYFLYRVFGCKNIKFGYEKGKFLICCYDSISEMKSIVVSLGPAVFLSVFPAVLMYVLDKPNFLFYMIAVVNFAASYLDVINAYSIARNLKWRKNRNKITISESEKSRPELLKEFATYDRSKEESYETEYHLGGEIPASLEKYGFSEYIKDVDTASDEIVFKLLAFVCDHFGHDGTVGISDKRDIKGLIAFCEQHEGKTNCRGLAMLLASLLRLIGVKARHITCMPYEQPFNDCHVVVDCLLPSGKRIMLDPTWRLYLKDEAGEYVSLEQFRELLLSGEPVFANEDASYNGGSFDLEYYRNYMTKNTIRFSRGTVYKDGLDDDAVRAVVLVPANYPVKNFTLLSQKDFVFDDREFWRM